jgi:hypothetical protein
MSTSGAEPSRAPPRPSQVRLPWFGSKIPVSFTNVTICAFPGKCRPPSVDFAMKIANRFVLLSMPSQKT